MLSLAILGCGSRGRTYSSIAALFPERYRLAAAADPLLESRAAVAATAAEAPHLFASAGELLASGRLADIAVISTQDRDHAGPALTALGQGYHLLLEKPAATTLDECRAILAAARASERRVILCYVLRHTPFYRTVREFVDAGKLGDLITIHASEGVEPWHQAHSFVRGHWARSADSTPMILAKSCHDLDLLAWFAGRPCRRVSSFGSLSHFKAAHAPPGATARCTDPCPLAGACMFDAHRYASDKRNWLRMLRPDAMDLTDKQIVEWLATALWGRCAWQCDNDAVDHQVVAMEFEGGLTASFTMTAFDCGRRLTLYGTKGVLRGGPERSDGPGGAQLWFQDHASGATATVPVPETSAEGYHGHGGGDFGLIDSLDRLIEVPAIDAFAQEDWFESHLIGFAAEQSRLEGGRSIDLAPLR
jgi:predicted dehydrogenase